MMDWNGVYFAVHNIVGDIWWGKHAIFKGFIIRYCPLKLLDASTDMSPKTA